MKFEYYLETDSLYLTLRDGVGVDVIQLNDEFCADLDSAGSIIGLDIQHASSVVDISKFELVGFSESNFTNRT